MIIIRAGSLDEAHAIAEGTLCTGTAPAASGSALGFSSRGRWTSG